WDGRRGRSCFLLGSQADGLGDGGGTAADDGSDGGGDTGDLGPPELDLADLGLEGVDPVVESGHVLTVRLAVELQFDPSQLLVHPLEQLLERVGHAEFPGSGVLRGGAHAPFPGYSGTVPSMPSAPSS